MAEVRFREPFPILYVADVERSRRFYAELLGFEPTFEWRDEADGRLSFVFLRLGETGIGLGDRAGKPLHGRAPGAASAAPTFELCIYVNDTDAAAARLRAAGALERYPPTTQPWGERLTYFEDPDGHLLHITSVVGDG